MEGKHKFLLFLLAASAFFAIFVNIAKPNATPQVVKFESYTAPVTQSHEEYTVILTGDSMTNVLGPNAQMLNNYLEKLYPGNKFGIFNYGLGGTNILSLQDRLEDKTFVIDHELEPILDREFEIIIIESFGHNPLSQFPLEEGKKKMNEALDKALTSITNSKPNANIIFLATIAPNKLHYAQNVVDLSPDTRWLWAEERIAYILNHIDYAKAHNIPVINVYEKTLETTNGGDLKYISQDDFIHPSDLGKDFISREIANYIWENNILPH